MILVKNVELKEGEYVTWVGVHALAWRPEWGEATEGFTQLDSKEQALYDAAPELLDKLRKLIEAIELQAIADGNENSHAVEKSIQSALEVIAAATRVDNEDTT